MVTDGTMDAIEAFELRPEDVVVASFPKSGTTWLQEVVYLLHHIDTPVGTAPSVFFCFLFGNSELQEDPEMKDSVMETKFPYLEYPYPGLKNVSERKGRRFLKTHLPYHLLPQSLSSAKSKVSQTMERDYFCNLLPFLSLSGTLHLSQPKGCGRVLLPLCSRSDVSQVWAEFPEVCHHVSP